MGIYSQIFKVPRRTCLSYFSGSEREEKENEEEIGTSTRLSPSSRPTPPSLPFHTLSCQTGVLSFMTIPRFLSTPRDLLCLDTAPTPRPLPLIRQSYDSSSLFGALMVHQGTLNISHQTLTWAWLLSYLHPAREACVCCACMVDTW